MTRDAFADRLLDLAYGELSGREAREVEAHAAACEACRAELTRLRETRRIMSALPDEAPGPGGERILLAAAREAAEARAPRRRFPPWLLGAAAAAFSLVVVTAVSYRIVAMRPLERPDSEALLGGPYATPPPAGPAPAGAPPIAKPPPADAAPAVAGAPPAERAIPHRGPAAEPAPASALRRKAAPAAEERTEEAEEAERAAPPPSRAEAARAEAERAAAPEPSADAELLEAPAPRSAAAAPAAPAAPAGKRAAPAPAAPAPSAAGAEPLRERAAIRAPARPGAEIRSFPGCEGETLRRVERDPEGRLVRYVREGRIGGRRLRIEHVYGADGALAGATVRDLDAPGALLDARALGLALPARAEEAGIDAPPRCGR
jgi:hypothetical protein